MRVVSRKFTFFFLCFCFQFNQVTDEMASHDHVSQGINVKAKNGEVFVRNVVNNTELSSNKITVF